MSVSTERIGLTRLVTGVPGLDTILGGGLVQGGLYLIHGPPGAGKTVLANQICFFHARAGRRVQYLTMMAEAHDRLLLHLDGLSFTDRALLPEPLAYASVCAIIEEEGLPGLVRLIREINRQQRPAVVVLDGLYVAQEHGASELEFRQFLYELQGEAALSGVTFLLLPSGSAPGPANGHMTARSMVDGLIELRDELAGDSAYRTVQVTKLRGSHHRRGRHVFRIADDGIRIFPRLETLVAATLDGQPTAKRLCTQIDGLDARLHGGLPDASTTLLAGPSGSGKTTFGLSFLSAATPADPGIFFGCYENEAALRLKAREIGVPMDELAATGAVRFVWQRPFEIGSDEVAHHLFAVLDESGAKRLFLDGLGVFRRSVAQPGRLNSFFAAMTIRLREQGVTAVCSTETESMLPSQELKLDDISLVAENTILLDLSRRDGRLGRTLSILKMRHSGFDSAIVTFEITDRGIVIDEPATAQAAAATAPPRMAAGNGVARRAERP